MENKIRKNDEYTVEIIDNGFEGEGIAKIDNYTIFIPEAIQGEKIKILIVKVNSSHAFGKIIEIIKQSNFRRNTDCSTYKKCGGCNLRHIKYEETLILKQNIVQNLVNKTLKKSIKVQPTIGMEHPYNYRNKAQYPIGLNKEGKAIVGVYAKRTHNIIPINECFIQDPISEKISKFIVEFLNKNNISAYDENTKRGVFRHIVTKVGINTNEIMCVLVVNKREFKQEQKLVKELINKFSNIKTIVKNINMKDTNVILGQENIVLYGDGYIQDTLGEYTFKISPLSFYQINPIQTEKLYTLARDIANLDKEDIVLDLYCGIGTIGIFISKYVNKVYGVEIIQQAIDDAKENAKINKIDNIEFYCGAVENVLDKLVNKDSIQPNVIYVDPPRKGLDNNTIQNILRVKPNKVVYISCNPATLVRDLEKLEEEYSISKIQPVDMFPFTSHVECVSLLELKTTCSY